MNKLEVILLIAVGIVFGYIFAVLTVLAPQPTTVVNGEITVATTTSVADFTVSLDQHDINRLDSLDGGQRNLKEHEKRKP